MIHLTPAYGRDYPSAKSAELAYESGADFIFHNPVSPHDGRLCSIRDFPDQPAQIRYARLTRATIYTPKKG